MQPNMYSNSKRELQVKIVKAIKSNYLESLLMHYFIHILLNVINKLLCNT